MKKSICLCLVIVLLPMVIAFSLPIEDNNAMDDLLVSGYKACSAGDWQKALAAYQKAVKVPEYSTEDTWFMLIISELNTAEYASAVQDTERFLSLFPESSYISYVRYHGGKAHFMLGNYVNAVYQLTEFCHAYPNHELYVSALFWIAESFFARENYDAAESLYERIAVGYPLDPKQSDAQSRLLTIRAIKQNNTQLDTRKKNNAGYLAMEVTESVPLEPILTEQQQFITTLIALNTELNTEKEQIVTRRKILEDLLARHSSQSVLQWTPEQQRLIADMMMRNSGTGATKTVSDDRDEKRISDLLGRSAELSNRARRPESEEIQSFIVDLQDADYILSEKQKEFEGRQRLIAELITSSMGLGSGSSSQVSQASQAAGVNERLSTLDAQFSDVREADEQSLTSEYATLLRKARLLWAYIVEQNRY